MSGPRLGDGRNYSAGIIVESWRLWEAIADAFPARRISDWRLDADYFELEAYPSIAVVIAQGASMIADAVERLAGASASCTVRLGTTGGLQTTQRIGDAVLPYAAIRGEGASRYYLSEKIPAVANLPLVLSLATALSARMQAPVFPSLVWTTDGRWVESDAEIAEHSRLGVSAVDMESAALFAVAMVRHVAAASVSLIADLPILHIGAEFKGLPPGEEEWLLLSRRAREVMETILEVVRPVRAPA